MRILIFAWTRHGYTRTLNRDRTASCRCAYLQKSRWFQVQRVFLHFCQYTVLPLVMWVRHGLRIHGKEKLKQHKAVLDQGLITVSNHVFMWDYICIMKAIRPRLQYHPGWKTNFEGPNAFFIRWVGGIPIPTGNLKAMGKFQQAIGEVLKNDQWLHFFPEGSMWFYYPDIRPLKKAVFKYAVRYDKPVIPITMSFRPRKGIWKLFGKNPFVDLHIGEPLFPDKTLSAGDAIDKLHKEAYHVMQVMNGINPGDPTYNTDQNIETYQKTM